jgi:hypothetical protein
MLLSTIQGLTPPSEKSSNNLSAIKHKRLINILQEEIAKIVDENGI